MKETLLRTAQTTDSNSSGSTGQAILWGIAGFGISLAIYQIVMIFMRESIAQVITNPFRRGLTLEILRYALVGGIGGAALGMAQRPQGKIIYWSLAGFIGCVSGYLITFPFFRIFAILLNPIFDLLHSIFGSGIFALAPSYIMTNLVAGIFAGVSFSILQRNWKQRLWAALAGLLGFGLYGLWKSLGPYLLLEAWRPVLLLAPAVGGVILSGLDGAIGGSLIGLCLGWAIAQQKPLAQQAGKTAAGIEQQRPSAPPQSPVSSVSLRLADPAHPARKQLGQAVEIIDKYVQVELVGDRTAVRVSAPVSELQKAVSSLDQAIASCPEDMDLLVAKASVLHASGQFKSAEDVLESILRITPDHFEAKMWKSHWETWSDALRFPKWDQQLSSVHPVMSAHLRLGHRLQVVRDGLQKTLAIVTDIQGPPFDSRTQVKVDWVLSQTPYGPLIAYYPKIIEPSGEPSTMEAFLPVFQPTLFSPMEGIFLLQQLAFTPYCFVVLVSGNSVLLNRKIVLGQKMVQNLCTIVSRLAATQTYLPQQQFQSAMQWHIDNFNMNTLAFE